MNNAIVKLFGKLRADKRVFIIVAVGILGIVLLVASELTPKKEEENDNTVEINEENSFEQYEKNLEERLKVLLESISGAGNVKVMITVESGDEKVYATESVKDANGEEKKFVLVDAQGDDNGLLIKVAQPEIRGVAVVCQGADSPKVRQEITGAVTSVLGISTNRVNVSKMKNTDGG